MAARDDETPARVEGVLRAYGAHPDRCPSQDRAAVLGAARETLDVARLRQGEAALDRLLDRAPSHVAAAGLVARIQAAAMQETATSRQAPSRWQTLTAALLDAVLGPQWRPAYALGGAVMLGVVAGAVWTPVADEQVAAADFLSVAFARDFDSTDAGDLE